MAELSNFERVAKGISDDNTCREHEFRWTWAKTKIQRTDMVLVSACGYGYEFPIYKEREPKQLWGIDKPDAVIVVKQLYPEVTAIEDDLEVCEKFAVLDENQFDKIISFETIEHLADPTKFLETCIKVLRNRGRLIGSVPMNSPGGSHKTEYNRESIEALLKRYFPHNFYTLWQDPCFVLFDCVKTNGFN